MIGEKSTSPAKLGSYGWVVITVVIRSDTAFPKKLGRLLAPGLRLLAAQRRRDSRVHWPALNTGACALFVATVSFSPHDDIDHPGSGADVTLVQLPSPVFVHKKVISTSTPQVRTTTVPVTKVSH